MYGDQASLQQLLTAVANGFVITRLQLFLFLVSVVFLVLVFVLCSVFQDSVARRRADHRLKERLEHRLRALNLGEAESMLLGRLTAYRGKSDSPLSLLADLRVLEACARRMRLHEVLDEATLSSLRMKLAPRSRTVGAAPSTPVSRNQRRKFYRRADHLPAHLQGVKPASSAYPTFLLDLGGGGAGILNVGGPFGVGDLVEVSFSTSIAEHSVTGRVLRVSKGGKVLNVQFVSLSAAERDRIMGYLFAQAERAGGASYPSASTSSTISRR